MILSSICFVVSELINNEDHVKTLCYYLKEVYIFQALNQLPREKIQIATKFGIEKVGFPHMQVNGSPEYVRSCCEASLKRLDVQYIDLYYQHRVDTKVPIEDTVSDSLALSLDAYEILACS